MTFKHRYVNPTADDGNPNETGPNEWNDSHVLDHLRHAVIFDDCWWVSTTMTFAGGIVPGVSATGAAIRAGQNPVSSPITGVGAVGVGTLHPGVIECVTGTTAIGRAGLFTNSTGMSLYTGDIRAVAGIRLPVLSDGTESFVLRACGFNDSTTANGQDAVYFRYQHSVNSGNWEAISRQASTETAADTGVAPSTTEFQNLEWYLNDDADSIEFFIDGASVATITTNIPVTDEFQNLGFMPLNIVKNAGTTLRAVEIDYFGYEIGLDR